MGLEGEARTSALRRATGRLRLRFVSERIEARRDGGAECVRSAHRYAGPRDPPGQIIGASHPLSRNADRDLHRIGRGTRHGNRL